MPDLDDLGIDIDVVREMYDRWRGGATKSELERRYLNAPQSHGKLFSSLVREHLGIETEHRSGQTARLAELELENRRLRALLVAHGIDPSSDVPED